MVLNGLYDKLITVINVLKMMHGIGCEGSRFLPRFQINAATVFAGNNLQIVAIVIISGKYVRNKTIFTAACRAQTRAAGSAGCASSGDTDNADKPP